MGKFNSPEWIGPREKRPRIVCLCGSTRFKDAFIKAQADETLAGKIVLTVGLFGHIEGIDMTGPVKAALDELHKRKIDLADEVLILNCLRYKCKNCGQWVEERHDLSCDCTRRASPVFGRENYEQVPYIGDSTRSELEYAQRAGKTIRWLNPTPARVPPGAPRA
jgi:hypothetical protein